MRGSSHLLHVSMASWKLVAIYGLQLAIFVLFMVMMFTTEVTDHSIPIVGSALLAFLNHRRNDETLTRAWLFIMLVMVLLMLARMAGMQTPFSIPFFSPFMLNIGPLSE